MEKFEELLGKTLTKVERKDRLEVGPFSSIENGCLIFHSITGERFALGHLQYCCEDVYIESIAGDLGDLVGTPILLAEEVSNQIKEYEDGNELWTFYKLATIKGYVDIRFYGSSNGYYSVGVNFLKVEV